METWHIVLSHDLFKVLLRSNLLVDFQSY